MAWEEFRVSVSEQTLSREVRAMGYRKLASRPKHHAQDPQAIEDFKKRMARPFTRGFYGVLISLRQRIRSHGAASMAKMDIRASGAS